MTAPTRHYLDFERPICELDSKIDELSKLSDTAEPGAFDGEIAALRSRVDKLRRDTYGRLDSWQKTQVARHPDRPHLGDFLTALIDDFVELKGDRCYGDDQAIVAGLGRFRGLPVITLIDTAGAYPGVGAEERGQGEAIARSTERGLTLGTPMVATITGEGGSGGALALAGANKVLILEHSIYSVISPEAGSSILFRDRGQAAHMAKSMKITAQDLIGLGIVDRIIPEPSGGAHSDREAAMKSVGDAIEDELKLLVNLSPDALRQQRADRFYAIGRKFG